MLSKARLGADHPAPRAKESLIKSVVTVGFNQRFHKKTGVSSGLLELIKSSALDLRHDFGSKVSHFFFNALAHFQSDETNAMRPLGLE